MQNSSFDTPAQVILCGIYRTFGDGAYQHMVSAIRPKRTIFNPRLLHNMRGTSIIPVLSVTVTHADDDTFSLQVVDDTIVIKFGQDDLTRSVLGHLLDAWGEIGTKSDVFVLRCLLEFTSSVLDGVRPPRAQPPSQPMASPTPSPPPPRTSFVEIDGGSYDLLDLAGATVNRANLVAFLALWKCHPSVRGRVVGDIVGFILRYDRARMAGHYYDPTVIGGMDIPIITRDPRGVVATDFNTLCKIIFGFKFGAKPWRVLGFGPECAAICAELCPSVKTDEFY
jgi:hypothetical protein